jgi:hypothetical protein
VSTNTFVIGIFPAMHESRGCQPAIIWQPQDQTARAVTTAKFAAEAIQPHDSEN